MEWTLFGLWIDRTVPRQCSLEVAQETPLEAAIKVDFGNHHGPPFLSQGNRVAFVVEDCREHPVRRDILVRAADQIDMILDGSRTSQLRITAPDRPCDDLSTMVGQPASNLGEKTVVANHHAQLAEPGVEYRILFPGATPRSISSRGSVTFRYLPAISPSGPINTATL